MTPLQGLRVLELGQYISAPYCGLMLADQGAEVIKIERPDGGDPRRDYDPLFEGVGGKMSGGFLSYNRGKRGMTLDLTTLEGRAAYLEMVSNADVIIENLRPGVTEKLGVGHDVLRKHNPRLIYAAISGFGRSSTSTDPYAGRPAFDTAIQAMGGMMHVTGEPGGPPLPGITGFSDIYCGVQAAFGILTALHARHTSGHGAFVDLAMYDAVASLLERELMLLEFGGEARERGIDSYAPVGALQAKDGFVALILPTDLMWARLCEAIGREDLLSHKALTTVRSRSRNFSSIIKPEAEKWTRRRKRDEIVKHLQAFGLPAGEVQDIGELLNCPHLEARSMFIDVDDPFAGTHRMIRTPLRLEGYCEPKTESAPQLGEYNAAMSRK